MFGLNILMHRYYFIIYCHFSCLTIMDVCAICFDSDINLLNLCVDDDVNHSKICKSCIENYIANTINSAYNGMCPTIYCPCTHSNNAKKILKYKKWSQIPELTKLSEKLTKLANGLLELRCGKCHEHSSIFVEYCTDYSPDVKKDFQEKFKAIDKELKLFIRGEAILNDTYQTILLELLNIDEKNVENNFKKILSFIKNPERRVNLYLRYLRDYPKVKTNCCSAEHCFNCKTYGYHDGKTCEEINEKFCNDILNCPCCGIALVKSEGCDTITCICGMTFSWEWEMVSGVKYRRFLKKYPIDTNMHCAEVLVVNNPKRRSIWDTFGESFRELEPDEVVWYNIHYNDVSKHLMNVFKSKYLKCPSQCSVVLPKEVKDNAWLRVGAEKWKYHHYKECTKMERSYTFSIKSLFSSLVQEKDRPLEAFKINNGSSQWLKICPDIKKSCLMWSDANYKILQSEREINKIRNIQQFVYLYGKKTVKIRKSKDGSPGNFDVLLDNNEHHKIFDYLRSYVITLFDYHVFSVKKQKLVPENFGIDILDLNNPNKWEELCDNEENVNYKDDESSICSSDFSESDDESMFDDTEEMSEDITFDEIVDYGTQVDFGKSITRGTFTYCEMLCRNIIYLKVELPPIGEQYFPKIDPDEFHLISENGCSLKHIGNFLVVRKRIYTIFNICQKPLPKLDNFYTSSSQFTEERLNKLTWNEIIYALSWYVKNFQIIDLIDKDIKQTFY